MHTALEHFLEKERREVKQALLVYINNKLYLRLKRFFPIFGLQKHALAHLMSSIIETQ